MTTQASNENALMLLWNTAVQNVGGMQNTLNNFLRISEEFKKLAEASGHTASAINNEINEVMQATHQHMIQGA